MKKLNTEMIGNILAVSMLVLAFAVSLLHITRNTEQEFDPSKKHIRIAHWQLELGYRGAVNKIIKEYEKLHPDVRVHQMAISERVYGQVINTNLVGGTAPDILEMGFTKMASQDQYVARFYEPMGSYIAKPNPYNKGTNLAKVPWRDTFIDGMKSRYKDTLQDYYGIPSSAFTVRCYYNKDLFRKITGSSKPPKTFGELMDICRKIKRYAKKNHIQMTPIAADQAAEARYFYKYYQPFFSNYEYALDSNLDGIISGFELYLGLRHGKIHWNDPTIRACYGLILELADNFQSGFLGASRQQMVFLFIQQKAAMLASGSWDAESLFRQANFDVGIFDYPMPAKNERYGKYIRGRISEVGAGVGAAYGIYRYSKHKDIAIDFLRFFTSRAINEKFNQMANWIPVVIGARMEGQLKAFAPNPVGFTTKMVWYWGGQCREIYEGALAQYVQHEIGYKEFGRRVLAGFNDPNYGWRQEGKTEYETKRSTVRIQEQLAGILTGLKLFTPMEPDFKRKYRELLIRQIRKYHDLKSFQNRFTTGLDYPLEVE